VGVWQPFPIFPSSSFTATAAAALDALLKIILLTSRSSMRCHWVSLSFDKSFPVFFFLLLPSPFFMWGILYALNACFFQQMGRVVSLTFDMLMADHSQRLGEES
jgi:hypothetical protein